MNRMLRWVVPAGLPLLAACGMTVNPVVRNDAPRPGEGPPELADPAAPVPKAQQSDLIRRVCRGGARPNGWIAIDYERDAGGTCPKRLDPDNPYTVAVIAEYGDQSVGAMLTVCADQGVPWGWTRLDNAVEPERCLGARVSQAAPSAYVMRRIR